MNIDLQNFNALPQVGIHLFSLFSVVELPRAVRAEPHLDQRVLLHTGLDVAKVNLPRPEE